MKLVRILILFFVVTTYNVVAQSIFTNPITGTNPNTSNPYTTGQTVDANITVSGIGRGTGIAGAAATNRYSASGWSTGAIDLNDYFEFTITPNSGCSINFVSFVYTGQISSGSASHSFRSSLDGFVSDIGTPTTTGTTISLSAAAYQNISTAITFRFYAYGLSAAGTTYSINDFTFNGTTSCGCVGATITTQPSSSNQTICSGSALTALSVVVTGTGLSYQWYSNSSASNVGGTLITGATSSTYSPSNTLIGTNYYYCEITGTCGNATSNVSGFVTVNATPAAPAAPTPAANPACTSTTLAVMVPPSGVTYYWQGTSASGTSTASPTSSAYTVSTSGTYYVRAQDNVSLCWSTSASVAITVNTPVTITTQPVNKTVCTGNNTTMDIVGAGTAPKQWQVSTDGGVTFNNVVASGVYAGVTNATMNITNPPISYNGYIYQCVVSVAGCPVVTSTTATLTVNQTPSAPSTPVPAANPACSGTNLNIMTGAPAGQTWYWQGTTPSGTSTTTDASTAVDNITVSGTYYVRANTDGTSCWSTTSPSVTVTINTPPSITTNPVSSTKCVGNNTTFTVAATGTSLTYQWQVNTGSGFTNLTNGAPYSTVTSATLNLTSVTAGMNGYLYQCVVSGASPCSAVTSTSAPLVITTTGEPSVASSSPVVSNVACNSFILSWTNGSGSNRLVVIKAGSAPTGPNDGASYTASPNFGSGSNLGASSFVVYNGSGNSVFVYGLSASTSYYYAIYEFNGCSVDYLTGGSIPSGFQTTGACTNTAGYTAVYVDACAGTCGLEGNNELIWGTSGSYGIPIATSSPAIYYGGSTNPNTLQVNTYAANASNTTAMNTAVGACGTTTFIDASVAGYVPPNSKFLIANSCICTSTLAYDFTNLCGQGPIYVYYGTNSTWPCGGTGGIFGNHNTSGSGFFTADFTAVIPGLDIEYNYNKVTLASGNGAYVTFNPSGGTATSYGSSACTVPLIVLPVDLISFTGDAKNQSVQLNWKVENQENLSHYEVEKSKDGINFNFLTQVSAINAKGIADYSYLDESPSLSSINYYKLFSVDNNGNRLYLSTIAVNVFSEINSLYTISYQSDAVLVSLFSVNASTQASIFDISGAVVKNISLQELSSGVYSIPVKSLSSGVYVLRVMQDGKSYNSKIIIY